jgi:cell division cycle 20-like protein 1, cofactor of APC complex
MRRIEEGAGPSSLANSSNLPEASADTTSPPFSPLGLSLGTKTPPLQTNGKRNHTNGQAVGDGLDRRKPATAEPVDPDALSRALREFEQAGRQRERTPGGSPSRKRQRVYGDRSVTLPSVGDSYGHMD